MSTRSKIGLASACIFYFAMFFLCAPTNMSAVRWKAQWFLPAIFNYDHFAYQWWLDLLSRDNWLVKIRAANAIWWCHQFTTCKVLDEHDALQKRPADAAASAPRG